LQKARWTLHSYQRLAAQETAFEYSSRIEAPDPLDQYYSFLMKATQSGHRRVQGRYETRSLPPLELKYSRADIIATCASLNQESLANLPAATLSGGHLALIRNFRDNVWNGGPAQFIIDMLVGGRCQSCVL
jgi:hypothetical protein